MPTINFSIYYSIDVEANKAEHQDSATLNQNISKYIKDHLVELYDEENIREYVIEKSQTTQVLNSINGILSTADITEKKELADVIANRLLKKEVDAQKKIEHLKKELQKGGLILTSFTKPTGEEYFVIAKVHFIDVLMEKDFTQEKATPEKEHMLKTIIIPIENDAITFLTTENKALITDSTKSKGALAASFWWKEFLEVSTVTTDEDNTVRAFSAIEKYLKTKFYDKHKMDYNSCRNSLIAYMKSTQDFTFDSAINGVMGDFTTLDYIEQLHVDSRAKAIEDIKLEMKSLNKTKKGVVKFDGTFSIDKTVVKAKMRKTIKLNPSISLTLEDAVENLRDTIVPDTDEKGEHIKIYSKQGYEEFSKN
jgi:preprotein translocase subunit Sss1